MKLLVPAIVLFIIGIILSAVTLVKFSKRKNEAEKTSFSKADIIRISIIAVCFIVTQILLLMNR